MYVITSKIFQNILSLFHQVRHFEQPADALLSKYFRDNRKLKKPEKNIIAETIYTILRNYFKLTKMTSSTEQLIIYSWIRFMNIPAREVENILPREYGAYLNLGKIDDMVIELPEWIIERLATFMTMAEIKLLDNAMSSQPDLTLRVNTIKMNRKELLAEFKQQGIAAVETKYSPYGVRIKDKSILMNNELFLTGCFEVQDEASQLAGVFFNAKRGEMITDFCAGSGGKTLIFGMTMKNSGRIYAFDNNERRLNNLKPRLARSGLSNIYAQLISSENDSKLKRLAEKMDRVFVDAPCLGLGTIRRNPDLKFRQSITSLEEMTRLQAQILQSASKLVKFGGVLAYATCSILREENREIVDAFIENNSQFEIINLNQSISEVGLSVADERYLELFPHLHNTDGFFCCLMKKN